MKELADIADAFGELNKTGRPAALATVIGVTGSTYRKPGARMLFSEEGRCAGLINAACLESDLSERAKKVIRSGKTELISYDTTSADDIVFGLGLGCNGKVEILMEPSRHPAFCQKVDILKRSLAGKESVVLATVVEVTNTGGLQPADFVAYDDGQLLGGNITNAEFLGKLASECTTVRNGGPSQKTFTLRGEQIRVFFEILTPPLPLIIFGAGPDAVPLVEAAKILGWNVTVVDHRPALAVRNNMPAADNVLFAEPERLSDYVTLSQNHVAVIMTHNFDADRKLLRNLLPSNARYVGLLGPKAKLQTLLQNLEEEGFKPTQAQFNKLHAPIGLDIGAETPEEIAFSIVSEIKAVLEGRCGGFLKDRKGPIH